LTHRCLRGQDLEWKGQLAYVLESQYAWVLGPLHCTYGHKHYHLTSYNGSTSWRCKATRRVGRNETETSGAMGVITKPPIGGWGACRGGRQAPHGSPVGLKLSAPFGHLAGNTTQPPKP